MRSSAGCAARGVSIDDALTPELSTTPSGGARVESAARWASALPSMVPRGELSTGVESNVETGKILQVGYFWGGQRAGEDD